MEGGRKGVIRIKGVIREGVTLTSTKGVIRMEEVTLRSAKEVILEEVTLRSVKEVIIIEEVIIIKGVIFKSAKGVVRTIR